MVNVTAFQISVNEGVRQGLWFASGSLIAETAYIVLSLTLIDSVMKSKWFLQGMQWFALVILLALAVLSIVTALKTEETNVVITKTLHPFLLGITMMGINPVQIPFWSAWTAVLFEKKIMKNKLPHYISFTAGAVSGAFAASLVFIFGGRWLTQEGMVSLRMIHWIIGIAFLFAAAWQLKRILSDKV